MGKSILVVDDSEMTRKLISTILRSYNEEIVVFEARDGQEALDMFRDSPTDIIIADWIMPNMNGLELLIEVRSFNKDVCFVMVTAEGGSQEVKQAMLAGANNYIAKPFSEEHFRTKFFRLL